MSALWEVHKAVYTALNGVISSAVYAMGNVPDGLATTYAVVGEATAAADDSDQRLGFSIAVVVHTWDSDPDSRGFNQVEPLMGEIYAALNRVNLTFTGYTLTDSFFEFEQANIDSDGLTAHGVQRFRVLVTTD